MKKCIKALLCVIFPLGILYLLMLRCQKRAWPEGMKSVRYAHRGLHHQPDAPENSLAAFRVAVDKGLGAELDVHLMKDGSLAVIHDSSLQRTAGADVNIEDLTREDLAQYRDLLLDFIKQNGVKETDDGRYLCQRYTEDFRYDGSGRLVKYTYRMESTPLYVFVTTGQWAARARTTELELSYRRNTITLHSSDFSELDGKATGDPLRLSWDYEIVTNADGLPSEVSSLSTDVYGALDCVVDQAEAGLFGVCWREGVINYYGELHGGFVGFDPANNISKVSVGLLQSLRISGTKADGGRVEYLLWPDSYGRQRCQKFTDGLYSLSPSLEMDYDRRNTYVMDEDRDEFTYRALP